jgi:GT2 family glycosyltransferase
MGLHRDYKIIKKSGLFDEEYYLRAYPDVRKADIDPLWHFVKYGWREGRNPSKDFDLNYYLTIYPDVKEAGINPVVHYVIMNRKKIKILGQKEHKFFKLVKKFFFFLFNFGPKETFFRVKKKLIHFKNKSYNINLNTDIKEENITKNEKIVANIFNLFERNLKTYNFRNEYELMKSKINEYKQKYLENIKTKEEPLIEINEKNFKDYLKKISFKYHKEPKVSIVIPVLNELFLTLECLVSIYQNTSDEISYEIIIVDDGSDDTIEKVFSKIKNIIFLKNKTNLGFVKSCNLGARSARGKFLIFLNNDTQVKNGWLSSLLDVFKKYKQVGIAGPKVIFPDGRLQEAGARINLDGTSQMIGLFDDPSLPRYDYPREVEYVSGVCLMIKRSVFEELGGFSEEFIPSYYEDVDLCFKAIKNGYRVIYTPYSEVVHHLSKTSSNISKDYKMKCILKNRQKFLEKWLEFIEDFNKVKIITFYLPQFHPIPENDLWWGKGFTEWRNVTKALPNFLGHNQPRLPSDLGFYDLRCDEILIEQANLAKKYGVYGFCYYYYHFGDKMLLDLPLKKIIEKNIPDIPFCLCWANENWTRRWDGMNNEVLIPIEYSKEKLIKVMLDALKYLKHPNYIRVNGKPLFLIYRFFEGIKDVVVEWRKICREAGIGEIYLGLVESFENSILLRNPSEFNLDVSVEFPPHYINCPVDTEEKIINPNFQGKIYDYRKVVMEYIQKNLPNFTRFRGIMPQWDNTPRQQDRAIIFHYANPGYFQAWLEFLIKQTLEQNFKDERIIFVNAWNEWAEGAYLEPDLLYGHSYLEAVKNALESQLLLKI